MSSEKRKYEQRARAQKQEETRRRIAAATAELHASVGPAHTTIAEIAKRAGVRRPTVYNNFPTEKELFAACQAHFLAESPPPVLDPADGLETVLGRLYRWWRANAAMSGNIARDRGVLPALDDLMRETADAQFDALADALGHDRDARAFIRIALDFSTWLTLARRGLSDAAAARLMSARASCR
ncbi:MAG TPA: helix-turn-helix domain-containing protein [Thermoleophilaceae bacterium]|nr:helix-turn-helix domain-containing protein [Thermoleophilaceae bacterium]